MCTNFKTIAQDGSVVVARSMEFPDMLGAKVTVVPRGTTVTASAPSGPGATFTTVHGVVGMDAIGDPLLLTGGMNEVGLCLDVLYMPGFAEYQSPDGVEPAHLVGVLDVPLLLLGTCATVQEAFTTIAQHTVWPQAFAQINGVPPVHYVLHDKTGASGVIEFRDGQQSCIDNPVGVATNAPYLDWHYNNIRLRMPNLQAANPSATTINTASFPPLSQGQGGVGLPGDGSSPSRFLRATSYVMWMHQGSNSAEQEMLAFRALNNFDIPPGTMRGVGATGLEQDDQTTWSSIASLSASRYIIRVQTNPVPMVVDLATTDFTPGPPRQVEVGDGGFKPLVI